MYYLITYYYLLKIEIEFIQATTYFYLTIFCENNSTIKLSKEFNSTLNK